MKYSPLNTITISGRLGRPPRLIEGGHFAGGIHLSLAYNYEGGLSKKTHWVDVIVREKGPGRFLLKTATKGQGLTVLGSLHTDIVGEEVYRSPWVEAVAVKLNMASRFEVMKRDSDYKAAQKVIREIERRKLG